MPVKRPRAPRGKPTQRNGNLGGEFVIRAGATTGRIIRQRPIEPPSHERRNTRMLRHRAPVACIDPATRLSPNLDLCSRGTARARRFAEDTATDSAPDSPGAAATRLL